MEFNMSEFLSTNQIQLVFIITAILGGVMHYLKKFLKGETETKIYEWWGAANIAATFYTVTVFLFAIIGAIAADVVNSQTGFWAAMYSGFVTGFAIDAGFNSDTSKLTTDLTKSKSELNDLFSKEEKEEGRRHRNKREEELEEEPEDSRRGRKHKSEVNEPEVSDNIKGK